MASENSISSDIEEMVAAFQNTNSAVFKGVSCDEQTDSASEVEIIKELKPSFVAHQCDLCCEGNFLLNKLMQFGNTINNSKIFRQNGAVHSNRRIKSGSTDISESESQASVICDICGFQCKSLRGLKRHNTLQHKVEKHLVHKCEVCMATFKNFRVFTRHCFTHTTAKKKLLVCNSCNKKFLWKKNLLEHVCNID